MEEIKIENKIIGYDKPVFVIAEAGVNHNGKLNLALKLVDAAAKAGADAIKFQTFKAEEVVLEKAPQFKMLKKLELKAEHYPKILKRCTKKNILFLSTPHGGFASVKFLQALKIPAFKFGSGDLTNLPVIQFAARSQKPIILSTGMANLKEIAEAVAVIRKTGNQKIIILHCTTSYPCPEDEVNLRAMETLKKKFHCLVGYSDHTLGIEVPIMAATLGAVVIEKHLTLGKYFPGPDHKASVEPAEFLALTKTVKKVRMILGSPEKSPTPSEKLMQKIARKSLVSLSPIKLGEKFGVQNLGIKRPGAGLAPKFYFQVLGKKAQRNIKANSLIEKYDLPR